MKVQVQLSEVEEKEKNQAEKENIFKIKIILFRLIFYISGSNLFSLRQLLGEVP